LAHDIVNIPNQIMVMQLPIAMVFDTINARVGRLSAKEKLLNVLDRASQINEA
jgi:hypothetical protein